MILRVLSAAIALCFAAAGLAQSISPTTSQSAIEQAAGLYDGGQMEIGALLELGWDGRYRYQLSYGALDEWSSGIWTLDGDAVVLTSDPYSAPEFQITSNNAPSGNLAVRMVSSDGIDPQYFAVLLVRASGAVAIEGMGAQGLTATMDGDPVVSLTPLLPMFDLKGTSFAVPPTGASLRISFVSNDFGFVGFDHQRLDRVTDTYDLWRHGRTLRFRKVDRPRN